MIGDERILGSGEFVERSLLIAKQQDKEINLSNRKNYDLSDLIKDACDFFKVDIDHLKSKSKTSELRNMRSMICYIASQNLSLSGSEIGRSMNLSRSAVSKLIRGFNSSKTFEDFSKQLST